MELNSGLGLANHHYLKMSIFCFSISNQCLISKEQNKQQLSSIFSESHQDGCSAFDEQDVRWTEGLQQQQQQDLQDVDNLRLPRQDQQQSQQLLLGKTSGLKIKNH